MRFHDADDLARWLETDPPAEEQTQAFDAMLRDLGHDATTLMWGRAILSQPAGADQ